MLSFTDSLYLMKASSEHHTKILWHVTSFRLLGSALVKSSLILFHCLQLHATGADTPNALPSIQDGVRPTCQIIFMHCFREVGLSY